MLYSCAAIGLLALVNRGHAATAPASAKDPEAAAPATTGATAPGAATTAAATTSAPPTTAIPAPSTAVSSPAPPVVRVPISVSHGPFAGVAPTAGALTTTVLASSIAPLPAEPGATTYPSDGQLHAPLTAPYITSGGVGT